MNENALIETHQNPIRKFSNNLFVALLLIVFPIVGLVLMWSRTTWYRSIKITLSVIAGPWIIIHSLVTLVLAFSFLYNGGSIQPYLNQDKMAIHYLQDKYGQEFAIGKSTSSSELGGPVTFSKDAYLKSDPSIKFNINKCLARCDRRYVKLYFTDTYINGLWSEQAKDQLQTDLATLEISKDASVFVHGAIDGAFNEQTKKIVSYQQLTPVQKSKLSYALQYNPIQRKDLTDEAKVGIAEQLIKTADYLKNQKVAHVDIFLKVLTAQQLNRKSQQLYQPMHILRIATPSEKETLSLSIDELSVTRIVNSFEE